MTLYRSALPVCAAVALAVSSPSRQAAFACAPPPAAAENSAAGESSEKPAVKPLDPMLAKALGWLVEAQSPNGGWGAGSHAHQDVRDPHLVQVDPATTSFAAMALLRAGNTLASGDYRAALHKAMAHLVQIVEESSADGPRITTLEGTQPQAKLGQLVDTSLTANFFARLLPTLDADHPWKPRVQKALDVCLRKLEKSQTENGSWNVGGWAPVLQSALSGNALELARAAGRRVDEDALARSRKYQEGNVDTKTGKVASEAAAGVELYAVAGAQRATAEKAKQAQDKLAEAKRDGRLKEADQISAENLQKAGVKREEAQALDAAFRINEQQAQRVIDDERLLEGFGSNGGEEFLSYLLSSESLVITGGKTWEEWHAKLHTRLAKIQNPDGSWSGHHCITSPVFCTAAVVQSLTVERDAPTLQRLAQAGAAKSK